MSGRLVGIYTTAVGGAPMDAQKRSLQLFIDEVMPAFADTTTGAPA